MCHREERSDVAISKSNQKRLPRPFRARNDNVNSFIAFVLDRPDKRNKLDKPFLVYLPIIFQYRIG